MSFYVAVWCLLEEMRGFGMEMERIKVDMMRLSI